MAMLDGLRRKEIGYLLMGLTATCALAWFALYAPAIAELKRLKAQVSAQQEAMEASMRQWSEMRASKGVETEKWEASIRRWDERLPGEPKADELMAEIGAQAVKHGLADFRLSVPSEDGGAASSLGSALAGGDPAQDNVARPVEMKYEIVFRSSYHDLSAFVDELPRLKRLVALRSLRVKEDDDGMEAKLGISAYHRGKP
jgi:Tfp pilus assembly protein PilO